MTTTITGLTAAEVAERVADGRVNNVPDAGPLAGSDHPGQRLHPGQRHHQYPLRPDLDCRLPGRRALRRCRRLQLGDRHRPGTPGPPHAQRTRGAVGAKGPVRATATPSRSASARPWPTTSLNSAPVTRSWSTAMCSPPLASNSTSRCSPARAIRSRSTRTTRSCRVRRVGRLGLLPSDPHRCRLLRRQTLRGGATVRDGRQRTATRGQHHPALAHVHHPPASVLLLLRQLSDDAIVWQDALRPPLPQRSPWCPTVSCCSRASASSPG